MRELTGDTQLSKKELDETTMMVTTPEKWDVITRKGGEVSAASALRLLIIDEVHLLNDDRGPVIETWWRERIGKSRRRRASIRIVGLSATLPNPSGRGVVPRGERRRPLRLRSELPTHPVDADVRRGDGDERDETRHSNGGGGVSESARGRCAGKQAMVFVHSRKDTVKTARQLAELAANDADGHGDLFATGENHPDAARFQAEVNKSRNPEVKELFAKGFGCHNAGMLRSTALSSNVPSRLG